MAEVPDDNRPLSDLLADICHHDGDWISVDELRHRFGARALGALLLFFSLICMLPLPPGATTVFGLPLLLLAPQLVIGNREPWLPQALKRRSAPMPALRKGLPKPIAWIRRVEALSRPRFSLLFGPVGERVIGVAFTAIAIVLIFPIPGGNFLPATAAALFALGLVLRDGVLVLLGYAVTAASATVLVLAAHLILAFAGQAITFLQSAWAGLPLT